MAKIPLPPKGSAPGVRFYSWSNTTRYVTAAPPGQRTPGNEYVDISDVTVPAPQRLQKGDTTFPQIAPPQIAIPGSVYYWLFAFWIIQSYTSDGYSVTPPSPNPCPSVPITPAGVVSLAVYIQAGGPSNDDPSIIPDTYDVTTSNPIDGDFFTVNSSTFPAKSADATNQANARDPIDTDPMNGYGAFRLSAALQQGAWVFQYWQPDATGTFFTRSTDNTLSIAKSQNGIAWAYYQKEPVGIIKSLSLTPSTINGDGVSFGTVTLVGPVPTDTTIELTATDDALPQPLPVPAGGSSHVAFRFGSTITIPKNVTTGEFQVKATGGNPRQKITVSIRATAIAEASWKSAELTINY